MLIDIPSQHGDCGKMRLRSGYIKEQIKEWSEQWSAEQKTER